MRNVNWLRQTMDCLLSIREQTTFRELETLEERCVVNLRKFAFASDVFLIKSQDMLVSSISYWQGTSMRAEFIDNALVMELLDLKHVSVIDEHVNRILPAYIGNTEMITVFPIGSEFFQGLVLLTYDDGLDVSADYLDFIRVCQMEIKHVYQAYYGHQKLEEYQVRFDGMLQTISQSIVFIDSNGQYCWVNHNAANLLNIQEYSPDPVSVRKAMMLLKQRAANAAEISDEAGALFTGRSRQTFYWRYEVPDLMVLKVTFMVIHTQASKGIMWVFDDVTREQTYEKALEDLNKQLAIQSKRTEESNRRYQYASRATSEAIWDWDLITGKIFWGDGLQTTFGHPIRLTTNTIDFWKAHVHPDDLQRTFHTMSTMLSGTKLFWSEEYRLRKADGSYAFVLDKCFIIRNNAGEAIRVVGAIQDISERVQAIVEAKALADDLYKRNKELQQFGYIVSHNLRAPVANIMGLTELLELDGTNPENLGVYTIGLKSAIGNLDMVLKDLNKILSIGDGFSTMPKEVVYLSEILDNVQTDLAALIRHNAAKIISPVIDCQFFTHKSYLYSILYNLISNAIKYRSELQPEVRITVSTNHKQHQICVVDNGIGIDLVKHGDDLGQPYKRFNTEVEGKGLGLFLVKSHVEAIDGKLDIESTPGQGTTFIISMPIG